MRVLFLAFGTRGDVQPLAVIAKELATTKRDWMVIFVTHTTHEVDLSMDFLESGVLFYGISSPPVVQRGDYERRIEDSNDSICYKKQSNGSRDKPEKCFSDKFQVYFHGDGEFGSHRKRQRLTTTPVKKMETVLEINTDVQEKERVLEITGAVKEKGELVIGWGRERESQHREECLKAVQKHILSREEKEGALIVFNLFALEGFHLAEHCGVPCMAAAPYVVPYRCLCVPLVSYKFFFCGAVLVESQDLLLAS